MLTATAPQTSPVCTAFGSLLPIDQTVAKAEGLAPAGTTMRHIAGANAIWAHKCLGIPLTDLLPPTAK